VANDVRWDKGKRVVWAYALTKSMRDARKSFELSIDVTRVDGI
jgi:hypothetical protein